MGSDSRPAPLSTPDDLFLRVFVDDTLRCGTCGHEATYEVPEIVDWRDREAVELLRQRVPSVRCCACAAEVPLERPVIVLRPGDPIPCVPQLSAGLGHVPG